MFLILKKNDYIETKKLYHKWKINEKQQQQSNEKIIYVKEQFGLKARILKMHEWKWVVSWIHKANLTWEDQKVNVYDLYNRGIWN